MIDLRVPATASTIVEERLCEELGSATERMERLRFLRAHLSYLAFCRLMWDANPSFNQHEIDRVSSEMEALADRETDWSWRERFERDLILPLRDFQQITRARSERPDLKLAEWHEQAYRTLFAGWKRLYHQERLEQRLAP